MAFPPRLFIIGAQKAATTRLATLLARHPAIAPGTAKELHFFSQFWDKGLDWYGEQYPDRQAEWLLDASPSYAAARPDGAYSPANEVAARISQTVSDPIFIYCLREPVARTYSGYWHGVRMGFETRTLTEATTEPSEHLNMSNYAYQLERYLTHFSLENFILVRFEDIGRRPDAVIGRILDRLGLAPMPAEDQGQGNGRHKSFQFSGPMNVLRALFPSETAFRAFIAAGKRMTPSFLEPLARRMTQKDIPPIPEADRARLAAYFAPLNGRLEAMTGLDLSDWEQPT